MKNKIFFAALVLMGFVSIPLLSQNLATNAPELRIETKDSIAAYGLFRTEAHLRMAQYEKKIDEFSARLGQEKPKVQNKNYPKVVALEKKDAKLRIKIESYRPEAGSDWITFKSATTSAIDSFGEEVANLKIED